MAIGVCKMCGDHGPLIRAHLIPDQLLKRMVPTDPRKTHVSVSISTGKLKRKQTLESDSEILCAKCDHLLGLYDEKFLRFVDAWLSTPGRDEIVARDVPARTASIDCDPAAIKLFILGTLIRFSASSRYPNLSLGPYMKVFSNWLQAKSIPQDYRRYASAVMIGMATHWVDGNERKIDLSQMARQGPTLCRLGQAYIYMFELLGLLILIKIGKAPWPESFRSYSDILRDRSRIDLPIIPFDTSLVFRNAFEAARESRQLD